MIDASIVTYGNVTECNPEVRCDPERRSHFEVRGGSSVGERYEPTRALEAPSGGDGSQESKLHVWAIANSLCATMALCSLLLNQLRGMRTMNFQLFKLISSCYYDERL